MPRQTISHYELLEPLGQGGMGVVHKARDLKLGRLAALKFLSPNLLGSTEAHSRFLREARSLSTLSHPHIATVYEVDEADGAPFMAMEYLPGGTLRLRVEAAQSVGMPIEESKILDWGIGLAAGLSHAHAKGIIHRDVKSSNAMFDEDGRIKLTDFGLAKELTSGDASGAGHVVGTVGYMSPEQIRGGRVDHRSDLYSLGVVLYEVATGQLPFAANAPAEMVNKILSTDPPCVRTIRSGVHPALDRVVGRLMSRSVDDRYQSAQEAVHDLQRIQSGTFDPALLSTRTVDVGKAPRAVRGALIGGAAIVVLVALGAGFWPKPPVLPENKNIFVLPLRSIGGDANQEALCDGLTEILTIALANSDLVSVVPPIDAQKVATVQEARRKFGVNLALSGSLEKRDQRVRLTLDLVDADKDRKLGTETIDERLDEPFEIEEGMLAKVADLLDVAVPRVHAALRGKGASSAPGAFDAYLMGRGFLYRYDKAGNLDRAQQQFEVAIHHDPQFALAHAGLAEVQLRDYQQRKMTATLIAARQAAESALALDPDLATAHSTYGSVLSAAGQVDRAIAELEKAIDLDPKDPAAYRSLAAVYESTKKEDRAEETYTKAIDARPGDWRGYADLGLFYYRQQRYADAERLYRKVIELTPDNHLGYRNLAAILTGLARYADAEPLLFKAQSLNPSAKAASNLATVYMFLGRSKEAVALCEGATEKALRDAPKEYRIWGNLGDAYWLNGAPPDRTKSAYQMAVDIAEGLRGGHDENADLNGILAEYYAKLGEKELAVGRIESALSADPQSGSVRYQAGLVYAVLKQDTRAITELELALVRGIPPGQIQHAPEFKKLRESGALSNILK